MSQLHRLLAEHEASHAVVARHYGLTVLDIRIGRSRGYTRWQGDAASWQEAAVTAAGDLWGREYSSIPYRDLACDDLKRFEREHGLDQLWQANRAARSILVQRRRAILTLADRLMRERYITFT